jgi:hypothetical protein
MHNQFEPEPIDEAAQTSLEQYLDQFCAPLERVQPVQEYKVTRQEMRAHLLLSVAAREELGATPEEALAEAIQRFGDPQQLGQAPAQEKNTTLRAKRRLSLGVRILGGLIGGFGALSLAPFLSFLMNLDTNVGDTSPPYVLQILLFFLGGRAGWLLASGKGTAAGGSLAGLAGSQMGIGMGAALTLLAYHRGWLAATYPLDSVSLCLNAGMGAAMGGLLWKRPKVLLGSVSLGIAVFGLPMLLIGLERIVRYSDYRNGHILSLYTMAVLIECAAGGITGAAIGLFARSKQFWAARKILTANNA